MTELTGQVLGDRYRVEAFLGRGGMADVYKVRDVQRAVFLAMKVLHANLAGDQGFMQHFVQEAQTLERLQHPNIVRFYGLEKADNIDFILMDFIDGLTLRREIFLFKNGLRSMRVLEVMQPVCAALYYAHQMGMIHCDIKPANIITHRNGTVFLTDFGIARATEPGSPTLKGVGTPAYMAPEQFDGKEPTQATDIYSLGVVLFEMLTGGQRPFSGDSAQTGGTTTQKIIWEKKNRTAPSPRVFNPEITPEMEAVVMCCLQRDPQRRFRSALDLLHALEVAFQAIQPPDDEAQTNVDLMQGTGVRTGKTGRLARPRQTVRKEAPAAGKPVLGEKKPQSAAGKSQPALQDDQPAAEKPGPAPDQPAEKKSLPAADHSQAAARTEGQISAKGAGRPAPAFDPSKPAESKKPAEKEIQTPAPANHAPDAAKSRNGRKKAPGKQVAQPLPPGSQFPPPGKAHDLMRRFGPWLMATAGGLVLALIALAVLSGPVHAPSPTLTPALVSQASSTPAAPTSTPPIPTSTALSAGTAIAPIAVLQPTETFPPEPTPIGGSQRIAFASDRSGSLQVWIMDAGNPENRQQVTEAKGGACQPAWSPDGTQIAFTTPCIGPSVYYPGSKIKIVRLADKSISDLPVKSTGVAGAFDPAWSPDGKTLLYTAIVGQNTEIRAIGLKDLKTRVLANRGTKNAQPAWSRDGKYIAYIYSDDRNWDALWSMGANGDSQELLARSGRFAEPAWAPDGLHILVSKIPGDNIPVLALFDRSDPTQDAVQLLPDTYRMSHASVSPDGRWAVFWTDKISNNPEILMIRMDGKQIHQLTNNNMRDFQPAWSPQ